MKHLPWHGNTHEALERMTSPSKELSLIQAHSVPAKKVADGFAEFETYIRNNCEFIPNFGERYRQGKGLRAVRGIIDDQPGGQPTMREEATDVMDTAGRPTPMTDAHQGLPQRTGGGVPRLVPAVPATGRLTPDFLTHYLIDREFREFSGL